jgi:hypothetical protein
MLVKPTDRVAPLADFRCEAFHINDVRLATAREGCLTAVVRAEGEGFPLTGGKSPRLTKGLLSLQSSRPQSDDLGPDT